MKKSIFLSLLVCLFAVATVSTEAGVFDFLKKKEGSKKRMSDKIVVGLSLPTQREERWVRDREQMQKEALRLGVDLRVQISDTDIALQNAQVENLLAQGIDVLILAPHDGASVASVVEKARAEGVPVIAYDRMIMNTDIDMYLSHDNVFVGELQGKYITEKVPTGNYILMAGAPTDNNAKLFKNGAMKYIQPLIDSGKINVVAEQDVDNWLPSNALKIVENALTKANNKVDAILAPNDGTAGGAIVALQAQGMAGRVPVTGQDSELSAVKRVVEGTQACTVFKDTRDLGTAAIESAITMAKGEKVETNGAINNGAQDVDSLLLPPYLITKENVNLLFDSGYIKKEEVYGK